ncbi:MAG: energy transducer TonB [Pseudomonadota bacterium]
MRQNFTSAIKQIGGLIFAFLVSFFSVPSIAHADTLCAGVDPENLGVPRAFDLSRYDDKCRSGLGGDRRIFADFDIAGDGSVENIRIDQDAMVCLADYLRLTLDDWTYECVSEPIKNARYAFYFSRFSRPQAFQVPSWAKAAIADRNGATFPRVMTRVPPSYPAECLSSAFLRETVTVEFDVDPSGVVSGVRVIESTNPCFEKTAIGSVQQWTYSKTDLGRRNVRTQIAFDLDGAPVRRRHKGEAQCWIFNPKKLSLDEVKKDPSRAASCSPPPYPGECVRSLKGSGWPTRGEGDVALQFDIAPTGNVDNVTVIEATNDCFGLAAEIALSKIQYTPTEEGFDGYIAYIRYDVSKLTKEERAEVEAREAALRERRRRGAAQKDGAYCSVDDQLMEQPAIEGAVRKPVFLRGCRPVLDASCGARESDRAVKRIDSGSTSELSTDSSARSRDVDLVFDVSPSGKVVYARAGERASVDKFDSCIWSAAFNSLKTWRFEASDTLFLHLKTTIEVPEIQE